MQKIYTDAKWSRPITHKLKRATWMDVHVHMDAYIYTDVQEYIPTCIHGYAHMQVTITTVQDNVNYVSTYSSKLKQC